MVLVHGFDAFRHQQVGGMKNLGLHRIVENEFVLT